VVAVSSPALELDLALLSVREVNAGLKRLPAGACVRLLSARGQHNLAVGLDQDICVEIEGPAGYYVGGLGKRARIVVQGAAGWGVGENLMSGSVVVHGNASQSAAATAHGGLVVVHGDASLRAGISLKGGTLAVAGDVGRYCGFLAQAGTILVGGDAAEGLGDSLYEAVIYVAGRVGELGTDARVEELTPADVVRVRSLCNEAGFTHVDPENVTRIGSARQLYHFDTQHAGSY
jgi:glutamate synthase domain-containing protein 3